MTKADLVELVYARVGCSKKDAGEVVEEVFALLRDRLRQGEKVKIAGFGTLTVHHKASRRGRNPRTGEMITIKPRVVCSFNASEILKERVLQGSRPGGRAR
jgi:integration host factor subunit alpha